MARTAQPVRPDRAIELNAKHRRPSAVVHAGDCQLDFSPSRVLQVGAAPRPNTSCRRWTEDISSELVEITTTATGRMWIDDEGIVRFVATGDRSTAETASENLAHMRDLSGAGPAHILFNVRRWPPAHPSFWRQFVGALESICAAGAVIVGNEDADRLGAFPALISTMIVPFLVTSDEEVALAFLRQHLPA